MHFIKIVQKGGNAIMFEMLPAATRLNLKSISSKLKK